MEVELNEAQPIPEIPAPSSRFREFQKADARYVKVEQLGGWIFFGILCVVELVLLVVLYLTLGFGIIYAILCVATLGLLLFLGWALQAYPAAAHHTIVGSWTNVDFKFTKGFGSGRKSRFHSTACSIRMSKRDLYCDAMDWPSWSCTPQAHRRRRWS